MTTSQKVIKYFALGLAALIVVGILSGIVFGGLGVLTATGVIKAETHLEDNCNDSDDPCLLVAMAHSKLEIKHGDKFLAEAEEDEAEIKQDDNKMEVVEKGGFNLFNMKHHGTITIYVPDDMVFKKAGISGGMGEIKVDGLQAEHLDVSLGIGEATFTNLTVNNAEFDCGIGSIRVGLANKADDYTIRVSKGIGDIEFNDKKIKNNATLGNGNHNIDISGGIGEIIINTR